MELILKIAAPVFAALVLLTNIITESIKKVVENVNAKKVALLTSIILSVITCASGAIYLHFDKWYMFAGTGIVGVIAGFIVAQVAETGYDGVYVELVDTFKSIIVAILGSKIISKKEDPEKENVITEEAK